MYMVCLKKKTENYKITMLPLISKVTYSVNKCWCDNMNMKTILYKIRHSLTKTPTPNHLCPGN